MKLEMSPIEETLLRSFEDRGKITNAYLQKLIKHDLGVKKFLGVYPCDLMRKPKEGQCIILNSDTHLKPGKHFVSLLRKGTSFYYFDPLAKDIKLVFPELYSALRKKKCYPLLPVLQNPIQAPESIFCGLFCLDFVLNQYEPYNSMVTKSYHTKESKLLENDQICYENIVKRITKY